MTIESIAFCPFNVSPKFKVTLIGSNCFSDVVTAINKKPYRVATGHQKRVSS
ncbi:MAG: hypothetical protein ACP5NL_06220 [Thermoplasmata archaeon]